MARIRSAKPEFWSDPLMCALPRDIRFTFKGIWEVSADDHGRFLADARIVKGDVWPLDDDITVKKVEKWLTVLSDKGRVLLYEVRGVRYGYIVNWSKHQRVSHPSPSRYPEPPPEQRANDSGMIREPLPKDSALSGEEGRGEERSGSERDSATAVGETPEEENPVPRVALPEIAERFLNLFYPGLGERQRQRYLDVKRQLYDVLDPLHPGVRMGVGRLRVKARSLEHFSDCTAAVLREPPRDRDVAIVFLLRKLMDPEKGPSEAEKRALADVADRQVEEEYQAELRATALRWANATENADEYATIMRQLAVDFPGADASGFQKLARDHALAQRCGVRAGFPSYDAWLSARQSLTTGATAHG